MNALKSYYYYYDNTISVNRRDILKILKIVCMLSVCMTLAIISKTTIQTVLYTLDQTTETTETSETIVKTLEPTYIVVSTSIPSEFDAVTSVYIQEEARRQEALEEEISIELTRELAEKVLEEQRIANRLAREAYIESIVCDPNDITRVSGLTLEDMSFLTEGTWWKGNEQALYDLENECGINAMFAMSVSTLESRSGTSDRASSRHNYYGIELMTVWKSLYDNTLWWGDMINRVYINKCGPSVWKIGPIYCPPNREWEVYMSDHMYELYDSLITKLSGTVE